MKLKNYPSKKIFANWKMNGTKKMCFDIVDMLNTLLNNSLLNNYKYNIQLDEIIIIPPFTHIDFLANLLHNHNTLFNSNIKISVGAQNCSNKISGAYSGDISLEMLIECGCSAILIGHSETRVIHKETNTKIKNKLYDIYNTFKLYHKMIRDNTSNHMCSFQLLNNKYHHNPDNLCLNLILCIGEDINTYKNGDTMNFLYHQINICLSKCLQMLIKDLIVATHNIDNIDIRNNINRNNAYHDYNNIINNFTITVAYEPIWAIGSKLTPRYEEISDITIKIKSYVEKLIKIMIGNSSIIDEIAHKFKINIAYGGSINLENFVDIITIPSIDAVLIGNSSLNTDTFKEMITMII